MQGLTQRNTSINDIHTPTRHCGPVTRKLYLKKTKNSSASVAQGLSVNLSNRKSPFDSSQGTHMPGFWAPSQVGGMQEAADQ